MKRAQIQLDEEAYEILRHRAFHEKKSIAGIIREIVKREILKSDRPRSFSLNDFGFVAAGRSKQGSLRPVSERHDEALEEAFQK